MGSTVFRRRRLRRNELLMDILRADPLIFYDAAVAEADRLNRALPPMKANWPRKATFVCSECQAAVVVIGELADNKCRMPMCKGSVAPNPGA